jgi:uncharacterized protein
MLDYQKLLNTLLSEFKDKIENLNRSVKREFAFPETENKIKVAIGVRRSGKTFLCLQKIQEYLAAGVSSSRILYLNFEDDRLAPATQETLVSLLEAFYTLYPENHDQRCYLFLDEIQNVLDWPLVVRRFFDTRRVNIFLTGSSAKLLSKEIATSLRGRSLATEAWPFSFKEYLEALQLKIPNYPTAKKSLDQIRKYLINYLSAGGFPDTLGSPVNERIQILQELVDVVVFRDIIERHGITNITLIKYLIKTLINNISTRFSVHKFCKDLKSQGIPASKNTIHDYLTYIEDAFLVFSVPMYSDSLRKIHNNPKKIYVVDPGLYHAYATSYHAESQLKNAGRVFENFIYLTFRRLKREVYYYVTKEGFEVDFLTRSLNGAMYLYQIAWDMNDALTLAREQRALDAAKAELGLEGVIITPENFLSQLSI